MLHVFNIHLAVELFPPAKFLPRSPLWKAGQSGIDLAKEMVSGRWRGRERHDLPSSPATCLGLCRQF